MKPTQEKNVVELTQIQQTIEAGGVSAKPAGSAAPTKASKVAKGDAAQLKKKKENELAAQEVAANDVVTDSPVSVSDAGSAAVHPDGIVIAQADTGAKATETYSPSSWTPSPSITNAVESVSTWVADASTQVSNYANQAWAQIASLSTTEKIYLGVGAGAAGLLIANKSSGGSSEQAVALPTLKTTEITSVNDSYSGKSTINLTFDKALDASHKPLASAFVVSVNDQPVVIDSVEVSGDQLILVLRDAVPAGALSLSVAYTDATAANDTNAIQDASGNDAESFEIETGVVADGYIRGARVYVDVNKDGAFNSGDIEAGTTDAKGRFYISKKTAKLGNIVVEGGVNIDTGVPNTMVLKAPAGSSVINPLTTLVAAVMQTSQVSAAKATEQVATALGLLGSNNQPLDLKTYDPIASNNVEAQKAAAQVASIVSLVTSNAGSSASTAANTVISNLAKSVVDAAKASTTNSVVTIDLASPAVVTSTLSGVTVADAVKSNVQSAITQIDAATNLSDITNSQSQFLDTVAPAAPAKLVVTAITNDTTPTIRVELSKKDAAGKPLLDGTAAVAGDTVTLTVGSVTQAYALTEADIDKGYAVIDLTNALVQGAHDVSAVIRDKASNISAAATASFTVDTDAPAFGSASTAPAINENSAAGAVVYTAQTTDANSVTYSLKTNTGDAAAFSINASTGAVSLVASPNFEAKASYSFTVVATDAAGNASEKAVTLAVNNLDEVAPIITSAATATAVNENVAAGTVVYTATSTDTGDTATGATAYSLKATGDASAFSINATTGAVSLVASPNFEAKSSYSFTVVATDAAGNASEKAVTLAVNNLDEVAPTITSAATATAVNENVAAGTVVYTATSTDTGDTATGATAYSLKATGDASAFSINASTGAVSLVASPNFEAKSSYSFTVVATDAAGNASEKAVTLAVNNLDEVAPTITSAATATAVNENVAAGTVVYTATSTDTGDTATGATAYSLKATGDASAFSINASTGAVSLLASPNYETKSSYSFTVVATDAAGNASEKAVTLAINNLDEVAPTITSAATATAVNENAATGTVVYTATSTDTGDTATGTTAYSLKVTGDASAFSINASTGAVSLVASPNYEAKASYSFTVVATDAAGNASEKPVTLAINNVNEAPAISSAATATFAENGAGAAYTTVAADPDAGTTLAYTIAGADAALFNINASTGVVTFKNTPNFEAPADAGANNVYDITVTASDGGLSDSKAVAITVTNVNEAPTVTNAIADKVFVVGGAVDTYQVPDNIFTDVDASTTFTYSAALANGSALPSWLAFDAATRTFSGNPTSNGTLTVRVTASDGALTAYDDFVLTSVTAPVVQSFTVTDGTASNGTTLGQSGEAMTFVVTLSEPVTTTGSFTAHFSVNGQDVTATAAAVSGASTITLTGASVPATGDGTSISLISLASSAAVTGDTSHQALVAPAAGAITYAGYTVDNTAPTVTSTTLSMPENSTAAVALTATDAGAVTWALGTGNDTALFGLSNGSLSLQAAKNYEADPHAYTVNVVATDAAGNVKNQAVTVNLTNVNEAPSISSGTTATFAENDTGTVYTTVATDPDANTTLAYTIAGADAALFNISNTGVVTFKAAPNFEAPADAGADNIYNITVNTTDGALSASKAVAITVTNVNEAPVISSAATATFAENGTGAAYTTAATDPDASTTLTYSLGGADAAKFSISNNGVVTFITAPNFEAPTDAGANNVYDIIVNTTDGALTASQAVALSVTNVNEVPVASAIANQTALVGSSSTINLAQYFTDPDVGDTLTYALSGATLPTGLTFSTSTGAISGTASAALADTTFHVVATDSANHSVGADFHLAALAAPTLTTTLGGVTNLDVRSSIVLSVGETVAAKAGGTITLTDLGGAGYQGENTTHTQTLAVDGPYVHIVGTGANTKILIDPQFDLDLSSNYSLAVSTGAFHGQTSGQDSAAFTTVNFSTVTPGVSSASGTAAHVVSNAVQAQEMNTTTGALQNSLKWLDVTTSGNASGGEYSTADASASDYAFVTKTTRISPDDLFAQDTYVKFLNFGAGDLFYMDDQVNQTASTVQSYLNQNAFSAGVGTSNDPFTLLLGSGGTLGVGSAQFVLDTASLASLPTNPADTLLQTLLANHWSSTGMVIGG